MQHTATTGVSHKDGAVWYALPPPSSIVVGTIYPVSGKCCMVYGVPTFGNTSCIKLSGDTLCCLDFVWVNALLHVSPLTRAMEPEQHWQKAKVERCKLVQIVQGVVSESS